MGKSSSKAPDYTPVAEASEEAARLSYQLGQDELDWSKYQFSQTQPLYERITNSLIETQDQTNAQGQDYYDYWKSTYQPVEQRLVSDALSYNTDAKRAELARQAAADAALAFQTNQSANQRTMLSMGVNPNSGRFTSVQNQNALSLAASRANAMTNARTQAEATGYTRLTDATSLGKGLAANSVNSYNTAVNAGNSAGNNASTAYSNYASGLSGANSTTMSGQSLKVNGLSNVLSAQTSVYGYDTSNSGSSASGIGTLVGTLATAGKNTVLGGLLSSDRRLKTRIRCIGTYANGLPMYLFAYRSDPDRFWIGVMADDVERVAPLAVSEDRDGFKRVDYGMLGINMFEVVA